MGESESKAEKQQNERRFDPELLKKGLRCDLDQYEFLKECSNNEKKGNFAEGIKKWNEWREENPDKDIFLEGADFSSCFLECVYLHHTETAKGFELPWFTGQVFLKGAKFQKVNLQNSRLDYANLQGAKFYLANLEGADFGHAWLQGANFTLAIVDNSTVFWGPPSKKESKPTAMIETVDRNTIFTGVPLDNVRIDPATKQLLEYNIRRLKWEEWYKEHPRLKCLVKPFWWVSDYGLSTKRIIFTFFGLALIFANIYYYWGAMDYYILHYILRVDGQPGFVSYLFVDKSGVALSWWLVPLRTLYFSIVTMTTLGFGDMYANAQSICGHILLGVQVILGYVLLGALVTRFAVLFTAGGPAGKFSD